MKYVVTVRGKLKDTDATMAETAHNDTFERLSVIGKDLGSIGHQTYLNSEDKNEFLAVDTWSSIEGLQKFLADPANSGGEIAKLFTSEPQITVWAESGWKGL